MLFIFIGVAGYAVLLLMDYAAIKKIGVLKHTAGILGSATAVVSFVMVCAVSDTYARHVVVRVFGVLFSVLFLFLLVYSLLIEIPFRKTYVEVGRQNALITFGTYGLVRHPGVLWLVGMLASLFAATGARLLLVAAPFWIAADVAHVLVQDQYFFVRMWGEEYREYQRTVPMLIPNRRSVARCIESLWPSRRNCLH